MPQFYSGFFSIHISWSSNLRIKSNVLSKYRFLIPIALWGATFFMIGWIIVGFLVVQLDNQLPNANSIRGIELKVPLRVYSADNLLISEFGDERRQPLKMAEIPQTLIDAVLASEDDRFYSHGGIDFFGLIRATLANLEAGGSSQGASTITMQVARNFYLSPEKTYTRKIKEILLALKLEQILSKDEILALYLNKIFLGHRSYGFGAAAEVYYNKPLSELSVAEHAMLAGLPKAPSSYNPLRNPVRATQRRNYVLGRMQDIGKISDEVYSQAVAQPVTARKHSKTIDISAPHIGEMVRAKLIEEYGEDAYWSGLNVYTTVKSPLQKQAQVALRKGLEEYDRRHGFRGPVARVSLDQLAVDLSAPADAYEQALADIPRSVEQSPALVLSVDSKSAQIFVKDTGLKSLALDDMRWARRHKTAEIIGDWITDVKSVLTPGDIVYVMPRALNDEERKTLIAKRTELVGDESATLSLEFESQRFKLSQLPAVSGALISIDPASGAILSLAGGYDFFLNKYNRAVQSIRQPGSNIKPFIYSASLDKGFTPASLISGAPIVMTDPAHGTVWRPENYSGKFFGPTRMREALGQSMNLVSIRLLRSIGIPFAREYIDRFGIDMNRFSASLTMALGSGGVTPLELLSAYGVLANGGYRVEPYFIERIEDRDGNVIFTAPKPQFCDECYDQYLPFPDLTEEMTGLLGAQAELEDSLGTETQTIDVVENTPTPEQEFQAPLVYEAPRVMSRANNFLTVSMMKDVVRRGTARKALALERTDLAGKTGTTNDYIDAWFTGFNSKVATTVWIGFDEPSTMGKGEAGSRTALPVWIDYMREGVKDVEVDSETVPEYIERGFVNRETGARTVEEDPEAVEEYFALEPLRPELVVANRLKAQQALDKLNGLYEYDDLLPYNPDLTPDSLREPGEEGGNQDPFAPTNEELERVEPEEKIVETEDETEGLF